MKNLASSIAVFLLCAASTRVHAAAADENWGQWRGPLGTGAAPKADPPVKWRDTDGTKEGIKWKVRIPGTGSSTPVIWGDQVFVLTAVPSGKKIAAYPDAIAGPVLAAQPQPGAPGQAGDGRRRGGPGGGGRGMGAGKPTEEYQFKLISLDRNSGKVKWEQIGRQEVPHEGHQQNNSFASSSPITDGAQVFAYFGSRGLYAYDMTGKLQWSKDFGDMRTKLGFGEGSTPALHGDTLVVNWDDEGDKDFIAALDKKTGNELWRQPRQEDTTWSTPLIVEHHGGAQVIVSATRKIRSYDLKTGKQIWECGGMTANAIPTPVSEGEMVYITSGFRGSALLAIRLGKTGDITDTDAIVWKHNKSTPYVPSPLLYDGKLYFNAVNNSILSCFDVKTGKPLFEEQRVPGLQEEIYASPVAARDRIYIVGRNGTTVVLKNGPALEVLATNKVDEKIDASPALAGQDLFLRGKENLYCIAN